MPHIWEIPLSKVKVLRTLAEAKVGDVLQIATPSDLPVPEIATSTSLVGLRVEMEAGVRLQPGLVVLDGPAAGIFITDEALQFSPAVVLNDFAHIALHDPAPRSGHGLRGQQVSPGDICHVSGSAGDFLAIATFSLPVAGQSQRLYGYVGLEEPVRGRNYNADVNARLGRAVLVPLTAEDREAEAVISTPL
jgi:hypothetical protein